jgi:hypothetical protein
MLLLQSSGEALKANITTLGPLVRHQTQLLNTECSNTLCLFCVLLLQQARR